MSPLVVPRTTTPAIGLSGSLPSQFHFQHSHRAPHGFGGGHHVGEKHLGLSELVTDGFHPRHETVVYSIQGHRPCPAIPAGSMPLWATTSSPRAPFWICSRQTRKPPVVITISAWTSCPSSPATPPSMLTTSRPTGSPARPKAPCFTGAMSAPSRPITKPTWT